MADTPALANGDGFLAERFRRFYATLVEMRRKAVGGGWAFTTDLVDRGRPEAEPLQPGSPGPTAISQTLITQLELGEAEAARMGGSFGAGLYREAEYAMAALADETFLHELDWEGKWAWQDHLVEMALFKTYVSGQRLFEKIDELLKTQDPVYAELASIYLLVLTLGFRGRYRGADDKGQIEAYRTQLFRFIAKRSPTAVADRPLFAQAYSHTHDRGVGAQLRDARPWGFLLAFIVVAFVVASGVLWQVNVEKLDAVIRTAL